MVPRVAEVAVAVATKGRKRGRSNGESYIFLHPHPPQVLYAFCKGLIGFNLKRGCDLCLFE
jgi:hypothetical protein